MNMVDKVIKVNDVFGSKHPDRNGGLRDREVQRHDAEKRRRRRAGGLAQTQFAQYLRPLPQRFLPRHEYVLEARSPAQQELKPTQVLEATVWMAHNLVSSTANR